MARRGTIRIAALLLLILGPAASLAAAPRPPRKPVPPNSAPKTAPRAAPKEEARPQTPSGDETADLASLRSDALAAYDARDYARAAGIAARYVARARDEG